MATEKRDLIDRGRLLRDPYFQEGRCPESHLLRMAIREQPTVDAVKVVHGRWIDDGGLDEDGNGQYRCSYCGVGEKHNPTVPVSYCWNCGAKMDGEIIKP